MKRSEYRIILDIHEVGSQIALSVKRGDTHRRLVVSFVDDSRPYKVADSCTAVFTSKKADGTVLFNSCTVKDGRVFYDFTDQTASAVGEAKCEIKLYGADGALITSPRFLIMVDPCVYNAGDEVTSTSEYSELTELMGSAQAILESAEQSKESAESAANAAVLSASEAKKAAESAAETAASVDLAAKHAEAAKEYAEEAKSVDKSWRSDVANSITVSKSGAVVHLDDVSPIEHFLNVKVKSRNKFDNYNSYNGGTYADGVLTVKGESAYKYLGLSAEKTYTFFCQSTRTGETGGGVRIRAHKIGSSSECVDLYDEQDTLNPVVVFTVPDGYGDVVIYFFGAAVFEKMCLAEGEADSQDYTPYVYTPDVKLLVGVGETVSEHTLAADGSCAIASAPVMKLMTDTDGAIIDVDYNRDINKALANASVGYSPTVSVTEIEGGHIVSITDAEGTKTFPVLDGAKGDKGEDAYASSCMTEIPLDVADYSDSELFAVKVKPESLGGSATFGTDNWGGFAKSSTIKSAYSFSNIGASSDGKLKSITIKADGQNSVKLAIAHMNGGTVSSVDEIQVTASGVGEQTFVNGVDFTYNGSIKQGDLIGYCMDVNIGIYYGTSSDEWCYTTTSLTDYTLTQKTYGFAIYATISAGGDTKLTMEKSEDVNGSAVRQVCYVDFASGSIGFYNKAADNANLTVYQEKAVGFPFAAGHEYVAEMIKQDSKYAVLRITDAYTLESDEISCSEYDVGRGWGARKYRFVDGDVEKEAISAKSYIMQKKNTKLLIVGDSYIEGSSLPENGEDRDSRYAMLIKNALGGDCFINGRGGAASADMLKWFNTYIPSVCKPEYTIVSCGGNDGNYATWLANLQAIIAKIEEMGSKPILTTIGAIEAGAGKNIFVQANAWIRNSGYDYIDVNLVTSLDYNTTNLNPDLFYADKVHPNALGHEAIFKRAKVDVPYLFLSGGEDMGDLETALDGIIAIQESLIGGGDV